MGSKAVCIPKLDFSRLQSGNSAVWDALQGEMMHALESFGAFEVVYGADTPELRGALFDRGLPEFFDLPLEKKLLFKSNHLEEGYVEQIPGLTYEILHCPDDVDRFARKIWPQGNLIFSDPVSNFSRHLKDLEQIIVRMLFVGLGVEKYYDSYTESTIHPIYALKYVTSLDSERKTGLKGHVDNTNFTIICQQGEGLEIKTKEGEWIPTVPSPNSFTVLVGEAFQAWTNGRLQSTLHRVRITNKGERYSAVFTSTPKNDCIVQAPKELVDEGHPLMFKPYVFKDYKAFIDSDGGFGIGSIYDFCGIREEERHS